MPAAINRATLIRETLTLQRDLLNGLRLSGIAAWKGESDLRQKLLNNLVFGRIRWPKSVGAPQSPTLNQGFNIVHLNTSFSLSDGGSAGVIETTNTTQLPEPYKWDEPDDTDHYCVGFFAPVQILFIQTFQPTFASNVAWPHFLNHYREIDPPSQTVSEINQKVILPDFTVSSLLF